MPTKPVATRLDWGKSEDALSLQKSGPKLVQLFYEPSRDKLEEAADALGEEMPTATKKRLIGIGESEGKRFLAIYPLNTLPTHDEFLQPKYGKIESIRLDRWNHQLPKTVEEMLEQLESLPKGFTHDPAYGLGVLKEYRCIVEAIDDLPEVRHIVISWKRTTGVEGDSYYLHHNHFEDLRRAINRITRDRQIDARKDREVFVHNELLTAILPHRYSEAKRAYKPDTIFKLIGGTSATEPVSRADRRAAIKVIQRGKHKLAQDSPRELYRLRNDLELVSLEVLISKFETMMAKHLDERRWQELFQENSFILNLAFGYPVFKIQDQAHVGGQTIKGGGTTITDFLVKNGLSNNVALFEIKKPDSALLSGKEYRDGLCRPASELVGAVSQILDQKYELQKSIATIKESSRLYDVETYAVHGVLVIGTMPKGVDQAKSFELYRGNSKDVSIVTFDELLAKLRQLLKFLTSSNPAAERATQLAALETRLLRLQSKLSNAYETSSKKSDGIMRVHARPKAGVDGKAILSLTGRCAILKTGFERARLEQAPFVLEVVNDRSIVAKTVEEFLEKAEPVLVRAEAEVSEAIPTQEAV